MPRIISGGSYIDKNRIASEYAFVTLLQITVIDPVAKIPVEYLHVTDNAENFDFNGQTYEPLPFTLNMNQKPGEEEVVSLSIDDVAGLIKTKVNDYGGGIGSMVKLMVVNSRAIAQSAPQTTVGDVTAGDSIVASYSADAMVEIEFDWVVKTATSDDFKVSWGLGMPSFLSDRFPRRIQMRDRCSWQYKGPDCGYAGPEATCDYSLQGDNGCAVKGNEVRFGGFPGITSG